MKLADIFGNKMLIQRDAPIRVFGSGKGKLEIEFLGKSYTFVANEDSWCFELDSEGYGGPYTMKVSLDGEITVIEDILIGDLYFAGGQSNMAFQTKNAYHDPGSFCEDSGIRFYTLNDEHPSGNGWGYATPETIPEFSAIGYYFALRSREYRKSADVPVGIVSCCKGSTCVETWIDKNIVENSDFALPLEKRHRDSNIHEFNRYGYYYDLMVKTLMPFRFCAVIWYQGESNRGIYELATYRRAFCAMVKCWREGFKQTLPFAVVQLTKKHEGADDNDNWAYIREAQLLCDKDLDNTAMITSTDLGDYKEIHPFKKKEVADRLFLAVRNLVFGEDCEYSGPIPEEVKFDHDKVTIRFSHAYGLHIEGNGDIEDLLVSEDSEGSDGGENFTIAAASVDGDTLTVSAEGKEITAVKYCFKNIATDRIFNKQGFPASCFYIKK